MIDSSYDHRRAFDPFTQLKKNLSQQPDSRRPYYKEKLLREHPRKHIRVELEGDVYSEYVWSGMAVCYWELNGWATSIIVPVKALNDDEAETVKLRNRIRDRILQYYSTLN